MHLTSLQNPKIKAIKRLEKSSERRAQHVLLLEGLRELCLASRAGYTVLEVYICEELIVESAQYNLADCDLTEAARYTVTREVYQSIAYRDTTEGIIAVLATRPHTLAALKLSATPLLLVVEGVEKPGNLGAMLRTCDATGIDAVILCDTHTDVYNPNVIRSSIGTVFTNQIALAGRAEVIAYLAEKKITSVAAELLATVSHYDVDMTIPTAIIVGTEATGISDEWLEASKQHIKIPMRGQIDSLNVSVSAAVILYEAIRQRSAGLLAQRL